MAVFSYTFMNKVSHFGKTYNKPLFLLLFKKIIIDLSSISSPVSSVSAFAPDTTTHSIDYIEDLVILAFEVREYASRLRG